MVERLRPVGVCMKTGDLVIHDLWGLAVVLRKVSPHVDRWWIRVFNERSYKKEHTCWSSQLEVIK